MTNVPDAEAKKARTRGAWILGAIAAAAIGVFIGVALNEPMPNTIPAEVAKSALQVVSVAVIGAVVGWVTFAVQKAYENAQKDKDQRIEAWLREDANRRDERKRQDDALRSLLNDTLTAYNAIKRERRLLRAVTPTIITVKQ